MKRTVVYGGTENLYPQMRVAMTSLLQNNQIDRVYLLAEHNTLGYELPKCAKVINVKNQTYFPPEGKNYNSRWSYMTLMRLALTKVLPKEKRVLWLDCDTIVDADISELFETDMKDNYYAGVKEPTKSVNRVYINAGILLINLEQIKKDKFDDRIIEAANVKEYRFPDQDAINEIAQGRILPISSKYNVCAYTEPTAERKVYHFAANAFFTHEKMYLKYKGGI